MKRCQDNSAPCLMKDTPDPTDTSGGGSSDTAEATGGSTEMETTSSQNLGSASYEAVGDGIWGRFCAGEAVRGANGGFLARSASECEHMCTAEPSCAAYTFVKGLDCGDQKCYLVTSCDSVRGTVCRKSPTGQFVSFAKTGTGLVYNTAQNYVLAGAQIALKAVIPGSSNAYMGVYRTAVQFNSGVPGAFEVFKIKKAGTKQKSCCRANGTFAYLDLNGDGLHGMYGTRAECETRCQLFAGCNYFETDATAEVAWCMATSECAQHCEVSLERPHTIYALANDQGACQDGYTRYTGTQQGQVNGRGSGELVESCDKCGQLCTAEEKCRSYYCSSDSKTACHLSKLGYSAGIPRNVNGNVTNSTTAGMLCIRGLDATQDSIATGKPVMQSSTNNSGIAERAVDGNTAQEYDRNSCTQTEKQFQPWWRVDLQAQEGSVKSVTLWNRADCCGSRLTNFQVRVGIGGTVEDGKICSNSSFSAGQGESTTVQCGGLTGKYVFVVIPDRTDILTLCEVSVVPMAVSGGIAYSRQMSVSYHDMSASSTEVVPVNDQVVPLASVPEFSKVPKTNSSTNTSSSVINRPAKRSKQAQYATPALTTPEYSVVLSQITLAPVTLQEASIADFSQSIRIAFAAASRVIQWGSVDIISVKETVQEGKDISTSVQSNPHAPHPALPMVTVSLRVMSANADQAKKIANNVQKAVRTGVLIDTIANGFTLGGIEIVPFKPLEMDKLTLQKIVIKLQDIHTCKKTDCAPEITFGVAGSTYYGTKPMSEDQKLQAF